MKKKLLFVMPSLAAGGGEKSLINLLTQIDYTKYEVDLFLFHQTGIFLDSLPKDVRLLAIPNEYALFSRGLQSSLRGFLRRKKFSLAYARTKFMIKHRMAKESAVAEQQTWKYQRRALKKLSKQYDTAIAFLEKSSIYFVVDCVQATNKIGWIHTNYKTSHMDADFDQPYFEQLQHLVTVSEECEISLQRQFPHLRQRTKVIYNIVSPIAIQRLAAEPIPTFEQGAIRIVTVGRLSREKGIDFAVRACQLLRERGHNIKWYVVGDGPERSYLERLIADCGVQDCFHLLGVKENPYPYMKAGDIYVQPSRYEGKSIAIDEAKVLHKPIVVTNFLTATDQLVHNKTGIIADMKVEALANEIDRVIRDEQLRDTLRYYLSKEVLGTETEIQKLYEIL